MIIYKHSLRHSQRFFPWFAHHNEGRRQDVVLTSSTGDILVATAERMTTYSCRCARISPRLKEVEMHLFEGVEKLSWTWRSKLRSSSGREVPGGSATRGWWAMGVL